MKLFQLLLSLLIFSICQAAESDKFYFLNAPNEIKSVIGTPDFYTRLRTMNIDSEFFSISKSILGPEMIQQFILAQLDIASSFYRKESLIDFKSPEIKKFASYLLNSIKEFPEMFDESKLIAVFTILIASVSLENVAAVRSVLIQHIGKLKKMDLRLLLLQQLVKYASTEVIFVVPDVLSEDFVSFKRSEIFLNDYIAAVLNKIDPRNYPEHIVLFSAILHWISKIDQVLSKRLLERLLHGIMESINISQPIHLVKIILGGLNLIFEKAANHKSANRLLIDTIFKILPIIDDGSYDPNIINLMVKCHKKDSDYFKIVIERCSLEASQYFGHFAKHLQTSTLALKCYSNLTKLTSSSTESEYRLSLSYAKNLRKIYKNYPEVINLIPNSNSIVNHFSTDEFNFLRYIDSPLNTFSLKIAFYMALIVFDNTTGDHKILAAGNIAFSLGKLLLNSELSLGNHPVELLEEVEPILDDVMGQLCLIRRTLIVPMLAIDLGAYMRFVRLHDSNSVVDSTVDLLCLALITSMPLKAKGYLYVRDLEFTDEAGIAVAGFLYFVQQYLKNPRREDINSFKGYFDYLVSKKFLNKSEQSAIRKIFNNFS